MYSEFSKTLKKELFDEILKAIMRVLKRRPGVQSPAKYFVEYKLSDEINRFIAFADKSLREKECTKEFLVLYWSAEVQLVKLIKARDALELQRLVERFRPPWAFRAKAFPLAMRIGKSDSYEYIWPQLEYLEVPRADL